MAYCRCGSYLACMNQHPQARHAACMQGAETGVVLLSALVSGLLPTGRVRTCARREEELLKNTKAQVDQHAKDAWDTKQMRRWPAESSVVKTVLRASALCSSRTNSLASYYCNGIVDDPELSAADLLCYAPPGSHHALACRDDGSQLGSER